MDSFFRRIIFLGTILFTTFLFSSDGEDTRITVSNAASVHENSGEMSFPIQLSESPDMCEEVSIDYRTENGSAKAGEDYSNTSGSVTLYGACLFPPHFPEDTTLVKVPIIDNGNYEETEKFYLKISNSTVGYKVTRSTAQGYIYDNEPQPLELTLHNRSENEQDSNWDLSFTARLNQVAPNDITVNYTTENSTALAGQDYMAKSGSIIIKKGFKDGHIPITIIGDDIYETPTTEKFNVKITSISEGTVVRDLATGSITDDDKIKIDISSTSVDEGNSGDNNKMPFKIFLAKKYPNIAPLTVNYTTEDGSATLADSDYTKTTGTVTFHPGDIEKIIYVPIIGDDTIEPDENLKMIISGSDHIINLGYSESEIRNDDGEFPGVDFSTGDFSIIEGNSSTKILNFNFTLDADAIEDTSFDYYTQAHTANADGDNDYVEISSKTYHIPQGSRNITIPVTINGDSKIEENELFYLKFTNEKHITIHGHIAKGNILNDDGSYPNLSFDNNSFSMSEGNSGQSDLNFTLSITPKALAGSSFDYFTEDHSAEIDDNDYKAISRTTHTFTGGETSVSIPVKIIGDTKIEGDQDFYLKIDNEHNLSITGTQSPTGEILNDDGDYPEFSIEASVTEGTEGDSGSKNIMFTIKLDTPAKEDGVSIEYKTVDESAKTRDNDYQEVSAKTLIFGQGEMNQTQTLSVEMYGDTKVEDNETFRIELMNPHSATLSSIHRSVQFTIINDDKHSNDAFECKDNDMYISSSTNRENGDTGRMWLHRIDINKNPFYFQVIEKEGAEEKYNATAFNPDDKYIYGLFYKQLIKLTKTGKVINLGEIKELPKRFKNKQLYAGAIYGGQYYVTGRKTKQKQLFKIDLTGPDKKVSKITLSKKVAIQDFSFSPDGKYLYGIDKKGKLTKIDVSDGTTTQIGENHTGYAFDSTFSDKNGRFFANDGDGAGFFEFDLTDGSKQFLSHSQPADYNDGANCLNASLVFTDYGDAPSTYGKAQHDIKKGIFMGDEVDHDITPYFSSDANGDDINGIDDEDGVTLTSGEDLNGTYFKLNTEQNLTIKVSEDGYLNAWIDYNVDGDFNDSQEKIFDKLSLSKGTHNIHFTTPNTITKLNETSYIRFRFSSTQNLNMDEDAIDGEVEDYEVKFGDGIVPLTGLFNIERTNSNSSPINSDARNAWYTQIVGRDFDYSILFYEEDLSAQKEIDSVVMKLELVDMESNTSLYERYFYIKNTPPVSRKDILISTDLESLPATKDARFRVSYGVDEEGSLLQIECTKSEKECYDMLPKTRTNYAKDNFAIRPETFFVTVNDGNTPLRNSRDINHNNNAIPLATGYNYNLTVTAAQYRASHEVVSSPKYSTTIDRWLRFKTVGVCANGEDNRTDETFKDGNNTTHLMELHNVGNYILEIEDNNWTYVDHNLANPALSGCLSGAEKNLNVPNIDGKVGCSIATQSSDINILFQPYKFEVTLQIEANNIPNSSHPDFLYMMNGINATNKDVAIQFEGDITAQSKDDINTTNFTEGCVANDINLSLIAQTLSEDGINQIIRTSPSRLRTRTDVNLTRIIQYNNDHNNNNLDANRTLEYINSDIIVDRDKFLNENNGSTHLQIRYNINKNSTQTINPVQITIKSFEVNSSTSFSEANESSSKLQADGSYIHYPLGHKDLNNSIRNFYFSQVAPDAIVYPIVNCKTTSSISTPVNVDIFCDRDIAYCTQTGLIGHTKPLTSPRASQGWYISIEHNETHDGTVLNLVHSGKLNTIPNPDPASPLRFTQGRNGMLQTKFIAETRERVSIIPSASLLFHPNPLNSGHPEYEVSCSNSYKGAQWTGIGKTGNILNLTPNSKKSHKMDW